MSSMIVSAMIDQECYYIMLGAIFSFTGFAVTELHFDPLTVQAEFRGIEKSCGQVL